MKINVKSLQGDEYIVDILTEFFQQNKNNSLTQVNNDQLVSDLKVSISEKAAGLPIERQKLVYKGRTMQDTSLVSDYGLEEGCKVHLILQKDKITTATTSSTSSDNPNFSNNPSTTASGSCNTWSSERNSHENEGPKTESKDQDYKQQQQSNLNTRHRSRFEIILREKLAKHFASNVVDNILAVLEDEINADINSSSLDDLERLAKQKLNISNE